MYITNYQGLYFRIFEKKRKDYLLKIAKEYETFSETISSIDLSIKDIEICFISLDKRHIHMMALAKKGGKVATKTYRITLSNIYIFNPPISKEELIAKFPTRLNKYITKLMKNLIGRFPPKTWYTWLRLVGQVRPKCKEKIDELIELRQYSRQLNEDPVIEIIGQERDAINLALRFSSMYSKELIKYDYKSQRTSFIKKYEKGDYQETPFLRDLDMSVLREDTMISNDAQIFGDWKLLKRYLIGATVFKKGDQRLTIMNINREKLEETLGVDLFYYHSLYDSFVLIQYKRMIKENMLTVFRPNNDSSYKKEIKRINKFNKTYPIENRIDKIEEYRLNPNGFFFKLCNALVLNPLSVDMIKGMYIPIDYWNTLLKSGNVKGPRGGIGITYDNVGRYFNNSQFISLLQDGWIGTRLKQSKVLNQIISDELKLKKSIILAANIDEGKKDGEEK